MNAKQMVSLTKKTVRHMDAMASGTQVGGILLAGDPGIGKTTYVETLGQVLGLPVIVIEVPHITEEHIINIPFVVFTPQNGQTKQMATELPASGYELVLAKSNLYQQLVAAQPMADAAYLEYIKRAPGPVQQLYQALGGTADKIPAAVAQARQNHHVILFLDEFYRQTSTRIRNILRGILNGNIGMHKIPSSVYVMYASNMHDSGVDDIPSNHQFNVVEYKHAQADDWFDYLVAKYKNDTHIQLNPEVIAKFKKILTTEDLSHNDIESEVRTSPRRWEQLLTYINGALPVHNSHEAQALLSNVRNNFMHYQTEKHSNLAEKVTDAVAELIKETSGIEVSGKDKLEHHEWRSMLEHAIEQQMKAGGKRKHIPVVSGPPGIGKTSQAAMVAAKHNLRLIEIDVSELYADDAIGMPIPGGQSDTGEMSVKFSLPKLYKQIMSLIHQKDEAYKKHLKEQGSDGKQQLAQYEKQPFKYLIFLDELNRVDEKTFNALRKVVLEKNFGPAGDDSGKNLTLPKDAIMVAAINPEGVGTSELTHHFRDVIDVIPAKASWKDTKEWIMARTYKGVPDSTKRAVMNIMDAFVDKFKSDDDSHAPLQRPFYLDVGAEMYVSPREYADMFSTLAREINASLEEMQQDPDVEQNDMREQLDEHVSEALEDSLNMIFYKHQVDKSEFMNSLRTWVSKLPDSVFNGVITKSANLQKSFSNGLEEYLEGKNLEQMSEDIHIVNANNTINNAQFIDNVKQLFFTKITNDQDVQHYIIDHNDPAIKLVGEELKFSSEKTSKLVNFFNALLYTLHIHDYQNDRLGTVGRSLSAAMSDLKKQLQQAGKLSDDMANEMAQAVVALRMDIHNLVAELR